MKVLLEGRKVNEKYSFTIVRILYTFIFTVIPTLLRVVEPLKS